MSLFLVREEKMTSPTPVQIRDQTTRDFPGRSESHLSVGGLWRHEVSLEDIRI